LCDLGISTTHTNWENQYSQHMVIGDCKYRLREISSKYDHL
jgi:hypothetical protein